MSFKLVNMRGDYIFALLRGSETDHCSVHSLKSSIAVLNGGLSLVCVWFSRHFFSSPVDVDKPTMIGVSNVVTFQNPNEPVQGHVALAENNDIR